MTSSPATLVVRDATPRDTYAVTLTLAAAFSDSPLGCWLDPDERSRPGTIRRYAAAVVMQVMESGIVRVVEDTGRVVAAAVWALHGRWPLPSTHGAEVHGESEARVRDRWKLLDEVAQKRRPPHLAHQQLVLLGVHPDQHGQGLSRYLLIGHHAFLHVTGAAAYTLADQSTHLLLQRYGYSAIGPPHLLPGRIPVWARWRPPSPAGLQ
jgi:GNAT superfamily N-acetyltransferase